MFRPHAAASLCFLTLCGCGEVGSFQARTTLHPDGFVTRTVVQDEDDFAGPEAAWETVKVVAPAPADSWRDPLADLPAGKGAVYASGLFTSAAALPPHVRFGGDDVPDADAAGLRRDVTVTDLGVLTEYRWEETLTAGTDPLRIARARRAALSLAAWYAEAVLEAGLPPGTDASRLSRWVRTFGDRWAEDLLAVIYSVSRANTTRVGDGADEESDQREVLLTFASVCEAYGLKLTTADDELLAGEAAAGAILEFARDLLRSHVSVDGRPLTEEQVGQSFGLLFGRKPPSDGTNSWTEADPALAAVREDVLAERFGTSDLKEIREILAPDIRPMFSVIGLSRLFSANRFAYRHRSPGLLVDTTGSVLSEGGENGECEVLFRFGTSDAFAFGHPMRVRSVVVHADRQRAWFGEVLVADRPRIVALLEELDDAEQLARWTAAVESGDGDRMRTFLTRSGLTEDR